MSSVTGDAAYDTVAIYDQAGARGASPRASNSNGIGDWWRTKVS
jgi:hypothetical protein